MYVYAHLLFFVAFAIFTSEASPLGDRATLLARYNSIPNTGSRSFILRSQLTPPIACNAAQPSAPPPSPSGSASIKRTLATTSITPTGWSDLCAASGIHDISITDLCFDLGQDGWEYALSAVADACVQQNIADEMISFAKIPGILNSDDIISYAISYRQQPREAVSVLGVVPSTLYCMIPPVNPELSNIVNVQPAGVNPGLFGSPSAPVVPFGSDGTCPYGSTPDVSVCACANINGTTGTSSAPIPANTTNSTLTGANSTLTGSDLTNGTGTNATSTSTGSAATLNGTDTTNSPLTGSNSTGTDSALTGSDSTNGTDTTNSTLTGSDSTNGTDTTNSTLTGSDSTNSIDSADSSTLTFSSSGVSSTGISATVSVDTATVSATATLVTSTDSTDASITSTASANASTGTSGVTFDGNIHDPAGR
ncbi:hypothetical protein C8J55DRAFT_562341 [Lentinula edodes]|uniref:Uncharacterized protein n=1 Tax=Lentinula lateritia TaxID=40482 RepID=A0A9W9DKV8_9AGAR|nr:hypothetical protein C8J55DRAFT_562341 [Lentinula edodes]